MERAPGGRSARAERAPQGNRGPEAAPAASDPITGGTPGVASPEQVTQAREQAARNAASRNAQPAAPQAVNTSHANDHEKSLGSKIGGSFGFMGMLFGTFMGYLAKEIGISIAQGNKGGGSSTASHAPARPVSGSSGGARGGGGGAHH